LSDVNQAGHSTPEGIAERFDLPTTSAAGQGRGIAVETAALAWTAGSHPQRRPFDDIGIIELEADMGGDDPFARCDILFADGERLRILIAVESRAQPAAPYRAFVASLLERLGPVHRNRIVFREGVTPTRRLVTMVVCSVLIVLCLGVLLFGFVSHAFFEEDEAWLGIPLILLFLALLAGMLRGTVRNRQKLFDPQAIPDRALPPAPPAGR
jgi:hypothetical protein